VALQTVIMKYFDVSHWLVYIWYWLPICGIRCFLCSYAGQKFLVGLTPRRLNTHGIELDTNEHRPRRRRLSRGLPLHPQTQIRFVMSAVNGKRTWRHPRLSLLTGKNRHYHTREPSHGPPDIVHASPYLWLLDEQYVE
jgi:hypothetical protein